MSANINNRSEQFFKYATDSRVGKVISLISNLSAPVYVMLLTSVIAAAIVMKSIIV